ncbi:MAG: hypothetical protein CL734_05600 [Chloroflexi bacterium]|nr:hypothetical protein [Chloroflexota bacterium]
MEKVSALLLGIVASVILVGCNTVGLATGENEIDMKEQKIKECTELLLDKQLFSQCLDELDLRKSTAINIEEAENQAIETLLFDDSRDKAISAMRTCDEMTNENVTFNQQTQKMCKEISQNIYHGNLSSNGDIEDVQNDIADSILTMKTCLDEANKDIPSKSINIMCKEISEQAYLDAEGKSSEVEVAIVKASTKAASSTMSACISSNKTSGLALSECASLARREFSNAGGSTEQTRMQSSGKLRTFDSAGRDTFVVDREGRVRVTGSGENISLENSSLIIAGNNNISSNDQLDQIKPKNKDEAQGSIQIAANNSVSSMGQLDEIKPKDKDEMSEMFKEFEQRINELENQIRQLEEIIEELKP